MNKLLLPPPAWFYLEEEEEDLYVFNDTIEGPRAPAVACLGFRV
jgi:hypothetical protein